VLGVTVVWTILVIGFLIFFHELGHFAVAKKVGIQVNEFAIGFGPKIFGIRKGETLYSLRILPLGGFVKMAGMDPDEEDFKNNERGFNRKSLWARAAVLFAGSFMHVILAIIIFFLMGIAIGIPVDVSTEPIIGDLVAGGPAASSGIMPGDRIIALDGQKIESWNQLAELIHQKPNQTIKMDVERNNEVLTFAVIPEENEQGEGMIGIAPSVITKKLGLLSAIKFGFVQTIALIGLLFEGLKMIISGQAEGGGLVGPVGVAQMIGTAARSGLFYLMNLAALLSVNFAIINLLPIPALDGGRILLLGVEAVRRKPIDPNKEGIIHFIGFVIIILLSLLITYKDIIRIGGAS
jgi:regulator of sigma E protease